MKRVKCLYRVSTLHQVEYANDMEGDIPMQREACHTFAEKQDGWVIVDEKYEKGISGSKVSAERRDAIQELKESASKHEFDVLLVFKFDRLGRIDSETPFILEWFVAKGIEMWSTIEGQQKIESRSDKLINYLRFWQAASESENTSQRVSTALRQMIQAGKYVGGVTPYGYRTVKSGKENKRGRELLRLEIHPVEAETVRMIFRKTVHEGYGSFRMSNLLNEMGYRMHSGAKFQCNTILRILANPIYCGFLKLGELTSPRRPDLQIIDDETYASAQLILSQRAEKEAEKRQIAMNTKGHTLLSGNIFCGHCGSHIVASSWWDRYTRKDGTKVDKKRYRYLCYHRSRNLNDCDGPSAYTAEKIDNAIRAVIRQYLGAIKSTPKDMALERRYRQKIKETNSRLKELQKEREKLSARLQALTAEIGRVLTGESKLDLDTVSAAISQAKEDLTANGTETATCSGQLEREEELMKGLDGKYDQFRSWAEIYDEAPKEVQKMIVGQLISRIEVMNGYRLTVYLNPTYGQFFGTENHSVIRIAG